MIEDDEDARKAMYEKIWAAVDTAKNTNQPVITATQGAGTFQSSATIQSSAIHIQPIGHFSASQSAPSPVEYMVILRYVDAAADEVKTKTVFVNGVSVNDAVRTATIKYNLKEHIVSGWAFASCDMSKVL